MRLLALALLLASPALLASSGGVPPDRKVYGPGPLCDDGSAPVLYAYGRLARLGPVYPQTCAWIDGYTARTTLRFQCAANAPNVWSVPAQAGTLPPGVTVCPVPQTQDFR